MRRSRFLSLYLAMATACLAVPVAAQTATTLPVKLRDADIPRLIRAIHADNIERTIRTLADFGTRNTYSSQDDPKRGIGAARDWLYGEMLQLRDLSGGRLRVEKQTFQQPATARLPKPVTITNIVAMLPGDLPEARLRYVIVSGHYDSRRANNFDAENDAPGANDDASGVAATLEIARACLPYHFHATLVFLCVAGEEQGTLGAAYFAEQAKQQNWRIEAMFTNDIIGGTVGGNGVHDDRSVRVFSEGIASNETVAEAQIRRSVGGEEDSASRQIARYVQETARRYTRDMKVTLIARRDRYLRGGDHIPFNERGYAAVRFTEPNEDYNHQHQDVRTEKGVVYGDLPEFVDFRYVANVARVNAAALAALASVPDAPQGAGLLTRRLTSDTDLQWQASVASDIAGYEIVWRETTAPDWTHSRFVGNVTAYTVKGLSKDNYLFGVRAVDRQNRKSPVAFPQPVR